MALTHHEAQALGLTDRRHVTTARIVDALTAAAEAIDNEDPTWLPIVAHNLRSLARDLGG